MLYIDSDNWVERSTYADENIVCTIVKNEVNMNGLHHKEEGEMTRMFHINIY
jgi:hypothetical protein